MSEPVVNNSKTFQQIIASGLLKCIRCETSITFQNQGFIQTNESPSFILGCCLDCKTNHMEEVERTILASFIKLANDLNMKIAPETFLKPK